MANIELNPTLIKIRNGKITQTKNAPTALLDRIRGSIANIKKGLIEIHLGSIDAINSAIDAISHSALAQRQLYLLFGNNNDNPVKIYSDVNPRRTTIMVDGNILENPKFHQAFRAFISILENLASRYEVAKVNFLDLDAPLLLEPYKERLPPTIQTDHTLAQTLIAVQDSMHLRRIMVYRIEHDQPLIKFENDPSSIILYTKSVIPQHCLTKLISILKMGLADNGSVLIHDQNRDYVLNFLDSLLQSKTKLSSIIIKSNIAHIQIGIEVVSLKIEELPNFIGKLAQTRRH